MKAIVQTKYGPPDVMQFKEIGKPTPNEDEVLVKIHAASINYSDWAFVRGKPFLVRLIGSGLLKPNNPILGADIAGWIEAVGSRVTQFQPGDEVFGDISEYGWGGFAEYAAVPENAIASKPVNLSFNEAAAAPQAAVVALQGLRDEGQIQSGQRVLINGASGGIGTFAVQIAKSFGAEVTGVCSTRNLDMVRSIGADHVIDYTQEDFAQTEQGYELILATAGYRSIYDYERALSPKGIYVMAGGTLKQVFQAGLLGPRISKQDGKKLVNLAAKPSREDLIFVKGLLEAGEIAPVIDRIYPLSEVPEALQYYGGGHARGKVVITVGQNSK
jgi:NADPH:quinone reductase-like Zn-dependent oxidoreductase